MAHITKLNHIVLYTASFLRKVFHLYFWLNMVILMNFILCEMVFFLLVDGIVCVLIIIE